MRSFFCGDFLRVKSFQIKHTVSKESGPKICGKFQLTKNFYHPENQTKKPAFYAVNLAIMTKQMINLIVFKDKRAQRHLCNYATFLLLYNIYDMIQTSKLRTFVVLLYLTNNKKMNLQNVCNNININIFHFLFGFKFQAFQVFVFAQQHLRILL